MHRLLYLLGALALARYAQHLLRADEFALYMLRDSLLLSAVAAILFAINALPLSRFTTQRSNGPRSPIAIVLLCTGLLCGLVSSALFAATTVLFEGGLLDNVLFDMLPLRTTLWLMAVICLVAGGLWPRVSTGVETLTHRWRRGEDSTFVRVPIAQMEEPTEQAAEAAVVEKWEMPFPPILEWGMLALLFGFALLLRMWDLYMLPDRCLAEECARLITLTDGAQPWYAIAPIDWLLQSLLRITEGDVRVLRLGSVGVGMLTIPLWYSFARQIVRPTGALAATALLALSPWHIRASAVAELWIGLPLLVAAAGGALLVAWRSRHPLPSSLVALSWGLLLAEATLRSTLAGGVLLVWLLCGCGIGVALLNRKSIPQRLGHVTLWLMGALAVAGPWLTGAITAFDAPALAEIVTRRMPVDLFLVLLRGGEGDATLYGGDALVGALVAAFIVLGVGVSVRWIFLPQTLFLVGGVFLCLIVPLRTSAPLESALLLLLPLHYLMAALTLDQLAAGFQRSWHFVVPARRTAVALPLLLLLLAFPSAFGALGRISLSSSGSAGAVGSSMGRYLAEKLVATESPATGSPATVYFIPPTLLDDSGLRAEVGEQFQPLVDGGILRPFDPVQDLFFTPTDLTNNASSNLAFLVPSPQRELLQLLNQLFPGSVSQVQMSEPDADGTGGQPLFSIFPVSPFQVANVQGLQATYFPAALTGSSSVPASIQNSTELTFDWRADPPFPSPFNARWVGLLLVPQPGNYRFFVDFPLPVGGEAGAGPEAGLETGAGTVSLHLDGRMVLDSAVGVVEKETGLARGAYRLEMLYQGGDPDRVPPGFEILWQRPGGLVEAIPGELLRNTPGAGDGLVATYFANNAFSGPSLTVRKDPLVGVAANLPLPYSVRWSGLFAASRAGEYLFGGSSSGYFRITVNGRSVVTKAAADPALGDSMDDAVGDTSETGAGATVDLLDSIYAEGLIYLPAGWHNIQIEHAPPAEGANAGENLQLFWQPPGSLPDQLPGRYFTSAMNAPAPGSLPLAPSLSNPELGDDRFALTIAPEFRNPQSLSPPDLLPPLTAQMVWQSGSCGVGEGQFSSPRGIAVDALSGRVYVADTGNQRLAIFEQDGTLVTYVESAEFEEPFDVDLLPATAGEQAATPLVLDAVAQQIWRIEITDGSRGGETSGEVVISPLPIETSFYRPRGFAVDPLSGSIGVADTGGARMVMLTPEGELLIQFGGQETAIGRGQPVDVLFTNNLFWGITAENGRLWRLDTALPGNTPSLLAVQPANTFDAPHFAGLPDGAFFLTDPTRRTILYYTAEGQPVGQWPLSDAFVMPVGIGAAQMNGETYVAVTDSAACSVSMWRVDR